VFLPAYEADLAYTTLPMKSLEPSCCGGSVGTGGRYSALSVGVGVENILEDEARPTEDPVLSPREKDIGFAFLQDQ
jgi:hypothetical protein